MAKVLQRLDILLFANTAQYRSEMRDTQQSSRTLFEAIKADAVEMSKVGAVALAGMAAAGTAAIGSMIKEQIELGNEITRLSRIANTGVEDMQKLAFAAKAVGVEQDTLGDIYKDTQDKIGDFLSTGGGAMADYFENVAPLIGQTAEEFRQLSGPDALQLYYDGLQAANLSQSEMVFYLEGIASDASALIPLLHDSGKGFDVWAQAAENAGAVMTAKTIRATQELQASNDLMMLSYDGAKKQFTQAFIPVLSDVAGHLVGSGNAADFARKSGEQLAQGFKGVAIVGVGVVAVFDAVGKSIGGAAATIGTLLDGVDIMDGAIVLAIKMAKNLKAAGQINQMVDQDIRASISGYGAAINDIKNLGTGQTNKFVSTVMAQNIAQQELNRTLGITGQQYQASQKAAEEAAKAGEKAATKAAAAAKTAAQAQARLVGIAGNSGIGTGSHIDVRYASGDARNGSRPSQDHVNRFEVNGKSLGSLKKTSDFNLSRKHPVTGKVQPHYGIDYDSNIGDNITTKVAVKDVKAWYDSKGGGYVTTVTFADGVKMNLLHQAPASKNIKGGSSGTASPYNAANSQAEQLLSQQAREDERAATEQARFAEQQAKDRLAIRMEYANEVVRIEQQLTEKIAKIDASGFSKDERDAFVVDAQQRAAIEVANYEDAQAKKLAAFSDFTRSERDLVTQNAIYSASAVLRDQTLTKAARDEALEFIKQKSVYELNQIDLTHDQQMQAAQQAEQTDIERIKAQYELERREIILTINMDERLRKAKIDALNQAEQMALDERRAAYERELRDLTSIGQSELAALRQSYAEQRRALDQRTDISDAQKSDLRNAMAGAQIYDTNQLQKPVRDGFNAQQADINGTGANYALAQQHQARLDVIKAALDAEVIAEEEAAQAKMQARQEFESAATQLTLASAESSAAALAGSFATMLGEQNAFYKLAFGAQQVFVVASAGLNMYEAWGDMMAQGATLSQKIAGAATIATEFGRIIGAASAITLELPGYQSGGYTGTGGLSDVAGLVHKEEFVSNAPTTRKYRPELEAMHNGTYERLTKTGNNININVTVTMDGKSSVDSDSAYGKQIGEGLAAAINAHVQKMTRPNGLLDRQYVKR